MFTFKGISTKEMRIIVEEPENLIAKAPLKHEVLNIEGRDDAIYYPLGYAPIEISLTLQLLDPSKIDEVLMWLDGEGELIYKDRKTKARIYSEIQPIRTSGIRIINIEVIRSPFWYALEDDYSEAWGANLIPNGWDSFQPYGSGKNYVENWDFNEDMKSWNDYPKSDNNTVVVGYQWVCHQELSVPQGQYVVRAKFRKVMGDSPRARINFVGKFDRSFPTTDEWDVREFEVEIVDESKTKLYLLTNGDDRTVEFDWIQITPIDNQHFVVDKTPLENGLTRIQTWGGNHTHKLQFFLNYDKNVISSFYIKNTGKNPLRVVSYYPYKSTTVEPNNDILFMEKSDDVDDEVILRISTTSSENAIDSLDFIASTPTIVEGDTPPTWEADENPRIINEGTAPSKPIIKLTKGTTNTCEFEVNGVYFKYHFNNDDHVLIDCDKMEASDNGQLRNRHLTIGFEFPVLEPGPNVVKRISGDAKIEFSRKDRWL